MDDHLHGNEVALKRLITPTRNRYPYGLLLDTFRLEREQNYFNRKRWLLNRLGLGAGVLCGLNVVPSTDNKQVCIHPGAAIDFVGREIIVPDVCLVDPRQPTDACGQPSGSRIERAGTVTLCLAYHECPAEPVPVLVGDCCTEHACVPSATRERYMVLVREGQPRPLGLDPTVCHAMVGATDEEGGHAGEDQPPDRRRLLCEALSDCPTPPDDVCVPIATVELLPDGTVGPIDTCTYRPRVYSNSVLLELILCLAERLDECCAPVKMLRYVLGNNLAAPVNTPVHGRLVVQVLLDGEPVANEPVTFEVVAGGGQIGNSLATLSTSFPTRSGTNGHATLPIWQLGPEPGENRVRASIASGRPAEFMFHATARAEPVPGGVDLPLITKIWPDNGPSLKPEDMRRLTEESGLEITYNREMSLANPKGWLQLFQVSLDPNNERPLEVRRFDLTVEPHGSTHHYRIQGLDDPRPPARYLVLGRAAVENIKNIVDSIGGVLLDADFAGTGLDFNASGLRFDMPEKTLLDALWDMDTRGPVKFDRQLWESLPSKAVPEPRLPSGDGTPGGLFHSWFGTE